MHHRSGVTIMKKHIFSILTYRLGVVSALVLLGGFAIRSRDLMKTVSKIDTVMLSN